MIVKKFKVPTGIQVKGMYKISQQEDQLQNGIPNKTLNLIVSVYTDHLEELKIKPSLGDYFSIGKRLYRIFDKTIEDVGPGSLMMNRGRVRQDFSCMQEDDEALEKNAFGANLGLESDINPNTDV